MFIIFQSGLIPLVHANRGINMYYNRLYHPSRNINHLFRKSVKRYSARFTLFLSARERAMDIIGYNYLKTMQNLHSENCLLAQHLSAKNLLANSALGHRPDSGGGFLRSAADAAGSSPCGAPCEWFGRHCGQGAALCHHRPRLDLPRDPGAGYWPDFPGRPSEEGITL